MGILCLAFLVPASVLLLQTGRKQDETRTVFQSNFELSASSLPVLEAEDSPYFSRQTLANPDGSQTRLLRYRSDQSLVKLQLGKSGLLSQVESYRTVDGKEELAYRASYDKMGRRILHAEYFDAAGRLESSVERKPDGSEQHCFYRHGQILRRVELLASGVQLTKDYEHGKLVSESRLEPPASSSDLVFWDQDKSKVRLKVKMLGARLASWEYYLEDGSLEHSGKVLEDESLEFSYFEKGKLKRRQIWRLVGEDWERSYYGLAYSELLAADSKTVEHKVYLRSNGSLKSHQRFNNKDGHLEMEREFDLEGRVARVEDFNANGSSKQLWVFPASGNRSRGFVPTGMRQYPGGDDKIGYVYDLDGEPFRHAVSERHPWSFFQHQGSSN